MTHEDSDGHEDSDVGLSRRDLLKLGAGAAVVGGAGVTLYTMQDDERTPERDDFEFPTATGTIEQFYKTATSDDLPRPDVEPALALTNQGWYEWLEGASEWTPLPSWWTRRLGTPDSHVPQGYIREFNDTLYLPPGSDIAAALEETDGGRVVLERGRYTIGSRTRIPGNVTVEGQGLDSVITPEADTDMFLVGGDFPSGKGNTAALRNLAIDTTSVPDYTSTVVTFSDSEVYQGGVEFLQNLVMYMRNGGERGTGIALVDESGDGISYVTIGDIRIMFADVAIRLEVNQGGFVNGNSSRNVWAAAPRIGIREVVNDGVIRSNHWNFRVNGGSDVERVLESRGARNRYEMVLFDLGRLEQPAITVEGDNNVLMNQSGSPWLWRWVVDTGAGNQYDDLSRTQSFVPQQNLPYWLETRGQGQLNGVAGEVQLVSGRASEDEFAVVSPEGLFSIGQYPWLQLRFDFDDGVPTGLARLGLTGERFGDAFVCADPSDVLETGVTDEFVTTFGSGSQETVERTGVGIDDGSHWMALRTIAGDDNQFTLLWVLDGKLVRTEQGIRDHDVRLWFSTRNTDSRRSVVNLEDTVEVRYAGPW